MGEAWPTVKLGDMAEITSSKRIKMADYVKSGVPFYRSKEIIERAKGNSISTELFISEDYFSAIDRKFGSPSQGDILLTSVGTLGVPYQVKEDDRFYFKDGNLTWFRNYKPNIDAKFLLCWLTSSIAKRRFDEVTIGSTQKALTIIALKSVEIVLPPLAEQKAIASVLGVLDDKIENNRRMSETLEEMARAIFKSWFVDFDPVHAKAAGNTPAHMDANTAALFSSSFGDDGLPVGWSLTAIEENGDVITGKTPSTKRAEYFGDKYPFIKIPNMNSVWVTETEISLSEAGHQVQAKKLLPKGSVVVSCIASPGAVAIVSKPSHTNQQINAVVPTKKCPASWLYCALVNLRAEIIGMASGGSVTPNLNKGDFSKIKIIDPSKLLMISFDRVTAHLFDKILSNDTENQILAELRDTLLPKLMSGEISVSDAEREVEAL